MKSKELLITVVKLAVLTFLIFCWDVLVRALVVPAVFGYYAYALIPWQYFYLYVIGVVGYHLLINHHSPRFIISLLIGFLISYALYVVTLMWDHDELQEYGHHAVGALFISVVLHLLYRLFFPQKKQVLSQR